MLYNNKTEGENMNQNVRAPLPGESIFYYCSKCEKKFTEKVKEFDLINLFSKHKKVKCPECGSLWFPNKTIIN